MNVRPNDTLVVVDVQNDFCPGGALGVDGGDAIVSGINRIMKLFEHCVFTRDWHPANHCSFSDAPQFVDGSWPIHCVQGTSGAAFYPDLDVADDAWIVNKATSREPEAYSGFDGTNLAHDLSEREVDRLFVCGLATDYCVKATALEGVREGFHVVLVEDLCRAVDNPKGSGQEAVEAMKQAGIALTQSGALK